MPVSAPKTEIKTNYSQPQSNYDRVQQVAAKQTSAQLKQPGIETEKRYIINPVNQTVAQVDKKDTVSGGVLQKALSAVGDYLYDRYKNKGGHLSDYEKQVMYNQGGVKGEDAGDSRAGRVVVASALNTVGGLATAVEGRQQMSGDNYRNRLLYNQGAYAGRAATQDYIENSSKTLDTDTFGTRTLAKAREETEAALAGLDPVEQFMTQTMISVLQNAYLMPVGAVSPIAATAALATTAAGNTMYDETTEGKNLQQAFTRGVIDGSIEFATEKIGVDNWLEMLAGKGGSVLKKLLIQSGSEAGEEALSYIAGYLVDVAEKEPDAAFSAQELMLSALGGAVSGMILGGGAAFAGVDIGGETDIRTQAQTAEQAHGQADAQTGMQARPRIDEQIRRRAAQNIPTVQQLAENGIAPQSDVDALTDTIVGENGESRRQVAQVAAAENRRVDAVRRLRENNIASREDLTKTQQEAETRIRQAAAAESAETSKIRRTMQAVEEFAAGKGLKVEYFSDGDRRAPEGYISGDTVYINMASDAPIVGVAVHEVGHRLKDGNTRRWNRYARSVSRLLSTNRELGEFAAQVRDSYTDPDSVRYSGMLDENGNIDRAKVDEEVILKVTQEILKRTADGDSAILQQITADRSLVDRLLDFIRGIKNSITIKLTGSEMAMLDEAERNLVNLMRGESREQTTAKFSLKTDSSGNPYVVIDEDILAGVPKSQWVQTVKKELKSHRINMGAFEVVVNAITRNEYINSKYTKYIERTGEGVYADKLRMAGNIDEIVQNAYNTRNEDARHKNFPSFNRSEINVRIGNRDYAVEVVTGINFNNNEILYDIVGIRTTKIKEAKTGNKVSVKNTNPLTRSTASNKNISQENYTVNQSSQTRQKNTTNSNKKNTRYSLDIRQRILQQTAKADNIKNRAVSDFTRQVRDIFGIDSSVSADIKTAVQDMATEVLDNGYVSPAAANRLFDKAVQLGSEIDDNYRQYDELRKRINRTGIEPVGGAEYRDFLARYRGKVKFKRGGIPLDTFYRELQEMYPEYFPDINNIYDRMEQIGRVYDDISNKSVSLEEYYGEAFRDFKEMSRTEFMERLDRFTARVNSAYRYNEALGQQQRRRQFANKAAAAGVDYEKAMESFDSVTELDNRIGRLKKQYAFTPEEIKMVEAMTGLSDRMAENWQKTVSESYDNGAEHILELYRLQKAKREIMRPLNDIYARQKDEARAKTIKFMRSMRLAKEKQSFRGLRYTTRSFERTVDRLIKDQKQNEAFKDEYVRPVHKAVTAAQRMKNEYRDRVRRLNLDQKKKYDVKFENRQGTLIQGKLSESGLVQAYGEGLINDSYLEQIGADSAKIKAAAGELKKIYRELYRQINETNIRNGYRPMEHRRDYFPHFQEEDGLIDKIRAKLGMGPQEELPIDIAGLTSQFTPGRKWNRFALQRTTDTTAYDALRGFDMYIETAADVIHTTDIIQKLRMLESSIRYMYSDRGVKDRLDEIDNNTNLSPNEKLEMKNKVYADLDKNNSGRGLTGFVQWLHGYTNGLAGKKSDADRDVEFKLGRGIYTFSKNFEGRAAANMIGGNISSALTNFIPITQMTAEVKGKYILAAMYDTMKSLHTNDGFDRQSDFLVRRFGSERLYETFWDKIVNAPVIGQVYNLMELVDEFSSNVVTRGMYIQKINEGMESRSAMQYADEFAARLMADRSKGALPTVYNEQNPIKKLFTMFQVEQANQFQYLFGDLPRIAGDSGKPLRYLLFMLFKVSLWAYLFNRVYEKIAGRKPAFSPLDITFDAAGRFTGKTVNNPVDIIMGEGLIEERTKMKPSAAIIETAKDVVEQVPFIGGFLGGGRVPVSSAGVDLSNLAKLSDEDVAPEKKRQILFEELSNPLAYLVLPGGGGQIRKIWQGGQLIADDGVMYATDKYGNKTVKFAVDINPATRAQALVFGQWASEPAQEYINSFKGLGKTQTGVFEEMKKEGRSNSRAFTFAQTITKSEEEGGADADGNGYFKSEEVQSYLDKQTNLSQSAKANIFRLLMPDVEDNPYEK